MFPLFYNVFSKYQSGFRKSLNTQQCHLAKLERWVKLVHKGKAFVSLDTILLNGFMALLMNDSLLK